MTTDGFWFGFTFALGVLFAAGLASIIGGMLTPKDDSDPAIGRSGVNVITDHKTGLQYLVAPRGGVTPRLDAYGRHVVVEPKS